MSRFKKIEQKDGMRMGCNLGDKMLVNKLKMQGTKGPPKVIYPSSHGVVMLQ
jgi:hypothetical protein